MVDSGGVEEPSCSATSSMVNMLSSPTLPSRTRRRLAGRGDSVSAQSPASTSPGGGELRVAADCVSLSIGRLIAVVRSSSDLMDEGFLGVPSSAVTEPLMPDPTLDRVLLLPPFQPRRPSFILGELKTSRNTCSQSLVLTMVEPVALTPKAGELHAR